VCGTSRDFGISHCFVTTALWLTTDSSNDFELAFEVHYHKRAIHKFEINEGAELKNIIPAIGTLLLSMCVGAFAQKTNVDWDRKADFST